MKAVTTSLAILMNIVIAYGQWQDQNSGITNDLNSVFFVDDNTGWCVGRQGKVIHTTDGGNNWSQQNSGTTEDLNEVHMVNANVGYAVGDNGTFIKYDGASWTSIDINYSQDMHGVHFLDADQGWISGDWGRIMMTTDGGSSWTTQMDNSTFSNLFYDLHMLSSNEGWAVGTSGKVLKYDGSSWSQESTPAGDDLFAVHFSSSNNGFMVGDQSKVYHYDGSGWSQHSTSLSSTAYDIEDVHVIDANTAYAGTAVTGGGGIILKYDGVTWSTEYENTDGFVTELFYGIHFPSWGKGYAVGPGGMIKSRETSTQLADPEGEDAEFQLQAYPNPSRSSFTVEYKLGESPEGRIELRDARGRLLEGIELDEQSEELRTLRIGGEELDPGVYFLELRSSGRSETRRLIRNP